MGHAPPAWTDRLFALFLATSALSGEPPSLAQLEEAAAALAAVPASDFPTAAAPPPPSPTAEVQRRRPAPAAALPSAPRDGGWIEVGGRRRTTTILDAGIRAKRPHPPDPARGGARPRRDSPASDADGMDSPVVVAAALSPAPPPTAQVVAAPNPYAQLRGVKQEARPPRPVVVAAATAASAATLAAAIAAATPAAAAATPTAVSAAVAPGAASRAVVAAPAGADTPWADVTDDPPATTPQRRAPRPAAHPPPLQ